MRLEFLLAGTIVAAAGCGGPEAPDDEAGSAQADRDTVFEPLLESVDRAKAVQQTVDEQAAELRRQLEEAEGR